MALTRKPYAIVGFPIAVNSSALGASLVIAHPTLSRVGLVATLAMVAAAVAAAVEQPEDAAGTAATAL